MKATDEIIISDDMIVVTKLGPELAVMHEGEKDIMIKMGELASQNGGDILELGFGLHLSADAIQSNPNVKSHTIIEIHPEIYKKALIWAKDKPNVEIILGDWYDVIPTLTKKFDGVAHDTFNDPHLKEFLDVVAPVCNKNAEVVFFCYIEIDERFNLVKVPLNQEDIKRIPYYKMFGVDFDLKTTTFNGDNFYAKK